MTVGTRTVIRSGRIAGAQAHVPHLPRSFDPRSRILDPGSSNVRCSIVDLRSSVPEAQPPCGMAVLRHVHIDTHTSLGTRPRKQGTHLLSTLSVWDAISCPPILLRTRLVPGRCQPPSQNPQTGSGLDSLQHISLRTAGVYSQTPARARKGLRHNVPVGSPLRTIQNRLGPDSKHQPGSASSGEGEG